MILEQRKWKKGVGDRLGQAGPAPSSTWRLPDSTRCSEVHKAERKHSPLHEHIPHWSWMTPHVPSLATSHSFLTLEVTPKQLPASQLWHKKTFVPDPLYSEHRTWGHSLALQNSHPFRFLQMKLSTLLNAPAAWQELPPHQKESKWKPEWINSHLIPQSTGTQGQHR